VAGGNRGRAELGFKPDTGEEKGKKERERETTWKADAEEAEGRKSPQKRNHGNRIFYEVRIT